MTGSGLVEFVAVVDSGSVTGAARALGVPRPTISKRLARLEARLGVRLLHRTTRRMTLTKPGAVLYEKARRVVEAAHEAEDAVLRLDDVPRGRLRILVPPRVPEETFTRWLTSFLTQFPEVSLDVVATDVHVDLVAEGFDVAMVYGPMQDVSLVSRTLVINQVIAVASPTYLQTHGTPACANDLAQHNCLSGYAGGTVPVLHWPLVDGGSVRVQGSLSTNHAGLRLEAARRHVGITLVVDRTATQALESGELVPVLPGIVGRTDHVRLVYPHREFLDPKVRAFVDFMVDRIGHRIAE